MKLSDICNKSLEEIIKEMELSKMEIHTDDDGNVRAIELKYTEKKKELEKKTTNHPWA